MTEEKEGKKIIQKNAALLSVAPILLKITETEEMPGVSDHGLHQRITRKATKKLRDNQVLIANKDSGN